jgi:ribonucleoside-diphosphate reductase alpha chain
MTDRRTLPTRREHELLDFTHGGIAYTVGVGRFEDGSLAEVFLDCRRSGADAETSARDCAVLASLCLQHEVPAETIRHALVKLADGSGAGPLGRALDLIGALR